MSVEGISNWHARIDDALAEIGRLADMIAANRGAVREIQDEIKSLEAREKQLRADLLADLTEVGILSEQRPRASLSVKTAGGGVLTCYSEELPDEYVTTMRVADGDKIRAALKAGQHVPGALLSEPRQVLAINWRDPK